MSSWGGWGMTCYLLLPGKRRGRLSMPFCTWCIAVGAGDVVFALFFEVSVAQDNILVSFTSKSFTWHLASDRRRDTCF